MRCRSLYAALVAAGLAAFVLFCALYTEAPGRHAGSGRTVSGLDDEFLAKLSNMGPFVYHNRLSGDAGFRRKMARLKAPTERVNSPREK